LLFGCLLAELKQSPATSPYLLQGVLQSPFTLAASGTVVLAIVFFRVPDGATAGWLQIWPIVATTLVVNYACRTPGALSSREA
jgi:hypothetical protein